MQALNRMDIKQHFALFYHDYNLTMRNTHYQVDKSLDLVDSFLFTWRNNQTMSRMDISNVFLCFAMIIMGQ